MQAPRSPLSLSLWVSAGAQPAQFLWPWGNGQRPNESTLGKLRPGVLCGASTEVEEEGEGKQAVGSPSSQPSECVQGLPGLQLGQVWGLGTGRQGLRSWALPCRQRMSRLEGELPLRATCVSSLNSPMASGASGAWQVTAGGSGSLAAL